ncbi:hypothetical protein ON010_g16982 [Phytophthora cinnamomi]|nr:hypothetical protein ON010_g16982 [Phytophthora cinnamomi]
MNSFTAFLTSEKVTLNVAYQLIDADKTGKVLRIMLDKYAYSLARSTDKVLSTNMCLAYFGNVKNWLVDKYPQHGGIVKSQLQNILSGLGKYCRNRDEGGLEKKAPPCSKQDLENIVRLLYTLESTDETYLDAALVVMMWYLYGRRSDAEQLEKQQLSILPSTYRVVAMILYYVELIIIVFKRRSALSPLQKGQTALLQGISLFTEPTNFLTCPLFAIAVALIMQKAPCKRSFPQFLNKIRCAEDTALQDANQGPDKPKVPGAQAYVNRLLVRVKDIAAVTQVRLTPALTSHSFRRGAAMHVNDGTLAENWIIERGGWPLDRGWKPKKGARLPSLCALEAQIRERARTLQALVFSNTLAFADSALNLDDTVADALTATLAMHYPDMLLLASQSTFVTRMREAMAARAIGETEVLTWSEAIRRAFTPLPANVEPRDNDAQSAAVVELLKRQSEQIDLLILQNKWLEKRLLTVEEHICSHAVATAPHVRENAAPSAGGLSVQVPSKSVRPKKKGS